MFFILDYGKVLNLFTAEYMDIGRIDHFWEVSVYIVVITETHVDIHFARI